MNKMTQESKKALILCFCKSTEKFRTKNEWRRKGYLNCGRWVVKEN